MNYMKLDQQQIRRKLSPQLVEKCEKVGSQVYLYGPETVLEVSVFSDDIIRFRYSPTGRFEDDFSYAIVDENKEPTGEFEFKKMADQFHVITKTLICKISNTLKVSIYTTTGKLISEDEKGFHWEPYLEWGGNMVYCSKRIQEQENFFGLGDKPRELNLKGMRLENWGSDTYGFEKQRDPLYKNIPFYFGLHHGLGYGIFFDNTFRTTFDFGHERGDVCSFWSKGGMMNYYFINGPELTKVAERYTELTGKPEMPPMWALGYQQSKWSYYPESKVREIAANFRKHEIPCDVIHIDIDYMDGFRCFTWDKEKFPDPKKMIAELEAEGFKTIVIIDPGIKIDKDYFVYKEGIENGLFCRRADGPLMEGEVWPGMCHFPDFTLPEAREWWATLYDAFMEDGMHGVWNDMNEPAVFGLGTFPDDTRHDYDGHPCSHRKAHNVYGMQMVKATYDGVRKNAFPKRPLVITRSGYSGLQRYSAVWTGDNISTWEHLWIANLQCQRLSISGISFTGSDIGGFIGQPNGELFVRWMQMAVFHPFFRTHSSGDHGDQEPWSFGKETTDLVRKAIELRYKFLPHIYSTFYKYVSEGTPMLLPLVFLDQNDPETYFRMEEFCMGEQVLVCPISEEGAAGRKLYLPRGNWYNYWTNEIFEGNQEYFIDVEADQIPIFIKSGAVLPHYPVMQFVGQKKIESLTLHIYCDDCEEKSFLYEDDGDFYDYQQGNYTMRNFTFQGNPKEVKILQEFEGRFNSEYSEFTLIIHGLPFAPAGMVLDGESKLFEDAYDEENEAILVLEGVDKNFKELIIKPLQGFS